MLKLAGLHDQRRLSPEGDWSATTLPWGGIPSFFYPLASSPLGSRAHHLQQRLDHQELEGSTRGAFSPYPPYGGAGRDVTAPAKGGTSAFSRTQSNVSLASSALAQPPPVAMVMTMPICLICLEMLTPVGNHHLSEMGTMNNPRSTCFPVWRGCRPFMTGINPTHTPTGRL